MLKISYPLVEEVEIGEWIYTLNLAFDNVLRLLDLIKDPLIDDNTKIITGNEMLLGEQLELNIEEQAEIFKFIFQHFIGDGEEPEEALDIEGNPLPQVATESNEKIYSIDEDADFIFASFYQDYGIDLIEVQGTLHWKKFRALLGGLRKDTRFKEVLEIRTMELPKGKGTAKERERIRKLKKQYALKGESHEEFDEEDEEEY